MRDTYYYTSVPKFVEDEWGSEMLRVTVRDGKYTVIQSAGGELRALLYGKKWRDIVGDDLILSLAQEVRDLREQLSEARR